MRTPQNFQADDDLPSSVVCWICWKDLGRDRFVVFRHVLIAHLKEAVKDTLAALEMADEFRWAQSPRDLVLYQFSESFRNGHTRLLSIIEEIEKIWEADEK